FKLEFADFVIVVSRGEIAAFDKAIEVAQTALDFKAVATLIQVLEINFVRFYRNPVPSAIKGITERQPSLTRKPTSATTDVSTSSIRIQDRSQWRVIVISFLCSTIPPKQEVPHAIFEACAAASLPVVRSAEGCYVTGEAALISVISGNAINHAPNRVASVEKGSRAFHNFHPIERKHVDGFHLVR